MRNTIKWDIQDTNYTFWIMYKGAKVELLRAKGVDAGDFFRLHAVAREELANLLIILQAA